MKNHILLIIIFSLLIGCNKSITELKPVEEPCRVTSIKYTQKNNGIEFNVIDYEYAFDKNTNSLVYTEKNKRSNSNFTIKYSYDSNNRIIEAKGSNNVTNYKYDTQGKLIEYGYTIQGAETVIMKYVYKESIIELYKYKNNIADTNLFEITYFTLDTNQNLIKIEAFLVLNGKQTLISSSVRTYNLKGQLLTTNTNENSIIVIGRYDYDANGNNTKIYSKVGNNSEYLNEEFSNFTLIPTSKKVFTEWQTSISESFNRGIKLSNWGTSKWYDSSGKLNQTIDRKYEYDANNILIRDISTIDFGGSISESSRERIISCPQ